MSIPVPLDRLRAAIAERGGQAYLLTVTADGRPHAVHGSVRCDGDDLATDVGNRTAANVGARPDVSLLFPVRSPGDYSLIVDGTATVATTGDVRTVRVTPTKGVLHRPAPARDPNAPCADDCVPLTISPQRR
jgi:hypothetical protein